MVRGYNKVEAGRTSPNGKRSIPALPNPGRSLGAAGRYFPGANLQLHDQGHARSQSADELDGPKYRVRNRGSRFRKTPARLRYLDPRVRTVSIAGGVLWTL